MRCSCSRIWLLYYQENVKYSLRLRSHGSRTTNGDGGLATVKGPDGTTFNFSVSSLSFNGTNRTRGQIPQIIYHSSPHHSEVQQNDKTVTELHARKCALDIVSAIVKVSSDLLYQVHDQAGEFFAPYKSFFILHWNCFLLLSLVIFSVTPVW